MIASVGISVLQGDLLAVIATNGGSQCARWNANTKYSSMNQLFTSPGVRNPLFIEDLVCSEAGIWQCENEAQCIYNPELDPIGW
jgi:hypothetical protein